MMIEGVISWEPSQETPSNGVENVDADRLALYVPGETSPNVNEPSSAVVADCTVVPVESFRSTLAPGMPSSWGSTLPGFPPPGLKSRQTAPVIVSLAGAGTTACFAFAGRSSDGIPVRPSSADSPGRNGVFR